MSSKRFARSAAGIVLILTFLHCSTGRAQADFPLKLTEGTASIGDVMRFRFSPDGSRVVYQADQEIDEVPGLYSVATSGGTPARIGEILGTGAVVDPDFVTTPDGSRVVFRASQTVGSPTELFSAPIAGGAVERLSPVLGPDLGVTSFAVSPDGTRVVFVADVAVDGEFELYSVPTVGGTMTKLNGPLPLFGDVGQYQISPDSTTVVYAADQDVNNQLELYAVPIAGGVTTKLNPVLPANSDVLADFKITPDSNRVVYRADQDVDGETELYSVLLNGFGLVQLNGALTLNGDIVDFVISPNGARVVYRGDEDFDGVLELYSVGITGAGRLKLNPAVLAGGDVLNGFRISPNSQRVVFIGDLLVDGKQELYSVPISSFGAVILNAPLQPNGDVNNFEISPDSSRVIYRADADVDNQNDLFSVGITGGAVEKLNGALQPGGDVLSFDFSPDSSRVVYLADQDTEDMQELYAVSPAGGPFTKLNGPLPPRGDVTTFELEIDAGVSRVVYIADQDTRGVLELYSVPLLGGVTTRLSGEMATGGEVGLKAFTPDGNRLVFIGDQEEDGLDELFSVPVDGGAAVKLNGPMIAGGSLSSFQISPDGSRVVYSAAQDAVGVLELYSVPVAGGAAVKLNPPLSGSQDVALYTITPDGTEVVYASNQESSAFEVFRVAIGGGPSTKLSPPMPPGVAGVSTFSSKLLVSPDGGRVVYLARQEDPSREELYSVPVAGGPAAKLNAPLGLNGGVETDFVITLNSRRVVFRARPELGQPVELFSTRLDGSGWAKLNAPLVAGGAVFQFEVSPDSQRVVYRADQDLDGQIELYSVLVVGGAATKLNGSFLPGSDVGSAFTISPDGRRVVYPADALVDNQHELFSVPLLGGVSVRLNPPPLAGTGFFSFLVSADSKRVVFGADLEVEGQNELFSVPIEGGATVKLNGPLVADGDVSAFAGQYAISPDGRRVAFRATAEDSRRRDLFLAPIGGGALERVNAPLPQNWDVGEFLFSPDGRTLAFQQDANADFVPAKASELYVWRAQRRWLPSSGLWTSFANWENGQVPDSLVDAVIDHPAVISVPSLPGSHQVGGLLFASESGQVVLELLGGAVLSAQEVAMNGRARVEGDGTLSVAGPLGVPAGAVLAAREGERLRVESEALTNAGALEASGRPGAPAELDLTSALTNAAGTGVISGTEAVLRVPMGLTNFGSLVFGAGLNEVRGDLANEAGGLVVVSGGAMTIFWEDVINNSVINVSAAGGLPSTAVFFGALSGNGIAGGGQVFIEGDARPGFSPGTMEFGGDLSYGPLAVTEIEIAGTIAGSEYDQITVAGHLSLGGALEVTFLNGFVASAGMVFDVWDASSVSGQFSSVLLPPLPSGLFWHTGKLNTTGELGVGPSPENYATFAAYYGLGTGPAADEEGDGDSNLHEYVTGLNPLELDAVGRRPELEVTGGNDRFSVVLATPPPADAVLEIQTSTTLQDGGVPGDWTALATRTGSGPWTGTATIELAPAGDGLQRVTAVTPNANEERRFYRMKIELIP